MKNYRFILQNLDCASCAKKIEDKISTFNEYKNVLVNFSTSTLSFETDKQKNLEEDILKIIKSVEPDVNIISKNKKQIEEVQRNNNDIFRLIIGLLIYFIPILLKLNQTICLVFALISIIILLFKTFIKACKQLKNKILDENSLIVISVIGAYLIGETMEGIMVITLYEIGKILEANAVSKTRNSISNLMDMRMEYANIKKGEIIEKVSTEDVEIGDILVIKSGEKIPLDGQVISGTAQIDNSALTGESRLIDVKVGDKVLSGGTNSNGLIEIKVETNYENSTVYQILNLVENATDKKTKTETVVNKFAKVYTPIVFILALLVAIFMPILFKNITYLQSIYRALTFLVISCPCSIAISVPLSYFSGIGKSSKCGILIKGSEYLDGLKDIGKIIFDKTGTITTGKFIVSKIELFNKEYTENDLLEYFAIGESFSNHPIAKAILNNVNKKIDLSNVEEFKEIPGKGIEYKINNKKIKIGNRNFIENININEKNIGTYLYLSIDETTVGAIILCDEVKQDAKQTISILNKFGIITKMFTGDNKEIALQVGKQVGISSIEYEMLPQDKYAKLEKELQTQTNKKIVFVGDGINDSPVLARADIGISMGGIGSSSAVEASDVVIMTDELSKIIEAIKISKKTSSIIKENLTFAIGVKIFVLLLSIFGIGTMWQAVFADVGTTLITILNTIRILK